MKIWFQIFSEALVDLSVVWFASVFVDTQLFEESFSSLPSLTLKISLAILSLILAKKLREEITKP
ncbi:MAG: hypothetical protein A3C30_02650 [Candidatus Levybacteria bacterium RIFCSPHIGHO2_02_FULL_40_18]|nr:MAG: hypothetical protein A2869_05325 [Candidatus Levybacteria bacterium RIFCSPHIGHO2_01_FULL_40_58]OGH26875.1 MAG: hypothetical protein A3C30_02650 [Candidatus Levybacteria bacterium RIFCSPHIGHO2_02_FULL_40_18]OGH31997.1 MAG: hypothetical protein A3E43_03630 [Candidatus Levybacteria bacterium RIFCSPHIGHO2_12_FULL_40_31]OGH40881.1 MAG: hypothetical protein A2894_04770 [Candidatus Levybacteria bacterium RIFCSPLOWO2_01_FULL_40_64]OGH49547.1 MAG: hypothetical protein A3I54_00175 [Candidatus Lev